MKNWDDVKNDRELLEKVGKLVDKVAEYSDNLPKKLCKQLNELTGNNWEPVEYSKYCAKYWITPWNRREIVYALFHDGKMPEKNQYRKSIVKTNEKLDLRGIKIRYALCTGAYGEEFRNKFEDLPEKEIFKWFASTFSGWRKEWQEKEDKVTAERIEYGYTTCTYSCLEKLEFPFDRFVGVTVSHDRTALVWGEGLSDDEKNSITDFFIKLGCKFID